MNVPHPDNPQHVDNLRSLTLLQAQQFQGADASLSESLEQGLVWRDLGDEWLFIYPHPNIPSRFDRCTLRKDIDIRKEWDWVNFDELCRWVGATGPEWDAQPLPRKVADLINYYGTEDIFGSSYWRGFEITK